MIGVHEHIEIIIIPITYVCTYVLQSPRGGSGTVGSVVTKFVAVRNCRGRNDVH